MKMSGNPAKYEAPIKQIQKGKIAVTVVWHTPKAKRSILFCIVSFHFVYMSFENRRMFENRLDCNNSF